MAEDATIVRRPAGARAGLRIAVVMACVLYVWGAPLLRQVGGVRHPVLRGWQMFSGAGLDVTQARYVGVRADGAVFVDPVAAGVAEPGRRGRFQTYGDAREVAEALCGRLGPGADVRLAFREATRKGWRVKERGRVNLCAPAVSGDAERSVVTGAGRAP